MTTTLTTRAVTDARRPPAPRRRRYTGDSITLRTLLLRLLAGALMCVFFIFPYAIMFVGAFKTRTDILRTPPDYWPTTWHPDNFVSMWSTSETPLPHNLLSTLVISVAATAIVLLVATPAAYYTARFRFPGRSVFLFLVVVTQMMQPTVLVSGIFQEMSALQLLDSWIAMILVNSAFNLAFAIWIMRSFFASIPIEIDEAAQIDGAGKFRVLFSVNLPLVWPGIVTAVIFTFVSCWNEFGVSLVIFSTAEKQPLAVALTKFVGQYQTSWQYVFGVSTVAIVPVVILFMLIEKRLVGGLTAGSVK